MNVLHDLTVPWEKRAYAVCVDGTEQVRSHKTGAGQFARGLRKGLSGNVRGRVTIVAVPPFETEEDRQAEALRKAMRASPLWPGKAKS